jgi:antitoxin component YwqK of YwqJK toxin-antitoxin module
VEKKSYHPNGALYDEDEFLNDKRFGASRTFNADGKLAKTTRHNQIR